MRKLLVALSVLVVGVIGVACVEGPFEVSLELPICRGIPLLTMEPIFPADSVSLGCPYAYIDENGDTITVVYDIPEPSVDTIPG